MTMRSYEVIIVICSILLCAADVVGYSVGKNLRNPARTHVIEMNRRSVFLTGGEALAASLARPSVAKADTGAEVRGADVTPFNSLMFQYRGSEYGGLDASDLDEPSVSYKEFVDRLKTGEVAFVEFMAPNGDAAYATFKDKEGKTQNPIRIGQGYPVEQNDGWSSPAFAVRTVKNAGVPYKFTVPALAGLKTSAK